MYRPTSPWSWTFVGIAVVQLLIVLGFEAYVFAKFEKNLIDRSADQERTIPTFLTLYIFGFIYQLVLVWDALRLKNTIQIYGLVLMNVGFIIYGAVQMEQIKVAIAVLAANNDLKDTISPTLIWDDTRPYLIAIPCVTALGTVFLAVAAWKLNDEFAWTIYKHISADLRMKRRYLTYQVYIALLKFDFFFFLGFTIQFVVIITGGRTTVEFALTIAAMPVTIVILFMAAFWTRRESLAGMISIIFLYFCGLAYFIFKMVRMYSRSRSEFYLGARKELTTFAVITIVLIVMTIVNACLCCSNFNQGLKPYISRRKVTNSEEKSRYGNDTEMGQGPNKLSQVPSRMTID